MEPIELTYENMDAVPEAFRGLYSESGDGRAVLTHVNGMKTVEDVTKLQGALDKERSDHRAAVTALKPWKDLDHKEVMAKLDRIPALEAAAEGKIDEDKMNEIIAGRLATETGPLQRQIEELTTNNNTLLEENTGLKNTITGRDRTDQVRTIAAAEKVHPTAMADIEMAAGAMLQQNDDGAWIVREGFEGLTPGLDIKGWMKEMQRSRPHWWPESVGGGSQGGRNRGVPFGAANPWSHEGWNMTEQGKVYREQGADIAEKMAKAAGTKVGGLKPPAKK